MRKFLAGLMVFVSLIQAQTPIIRVMQSREYKTPKTWWREPLTFNLRGYLADDTTGMSTATNASGVALYNNNFGLAKKLEIFDKSLSKILNKNSKAMRKKYHNSFLKNRKKLIYYLESKANENLNSKDI